MITFLWQALQPFFINDISLSCKLLGICPWKNVSRIGTYSLVLKFLPMREMSTIFSITRYIQVTQIRLFEIVYLFCTSFFHNFSRALIEAKEGGNYWDEIDWIIISYSAIFGGKSAHRDNDLCKYKSFIGSGVLLMGYPSIILTAKRRE